MSSMTTDDLRAANDRFYAALADLLAGKSGSMTELWSKADDVTYMGPMGDLLVGWKAVGDAWQQQAEAEFGGSARPQDNRFIVGGQIGIVVGFERGSRFVDGKEVPLNIRATNTFRLEDGIVKMIGHHTDLF